VKSISLLFALVLALASLPIPSSAELATWDQARVTALAKQLADNTSALYDTFYNQPTATLGSGQNRAFYRLQQKIRRIRLESRHLAAELKDGKGHDETLPSFEDIMELVRDAQVEAPKIFQSQQIQDKARACRETLEQIAPFYDANAPPSPDSGSASGSEG
jgi:uncharacterized membrane protein YccC